MLNLRLIYQKRIRGCEYVLNIYRTFVGLRIFVYQETNDSCLSPITAEQPHLLKNAIIEP